MTNWMWLVIFAAAAGHALRWVPPDAAARTVKIPAAFAILYVVYAIALAAGRMQGLLLAFVAVEVLLQIVKRRWKSAGSSSGEGRGRLRR
jgi:hypothetical protein